MRQAAGQSQERAPRWRGGFVALAVVAAVLALPFPTLAQDATWEGNIDNDYNNGGNWSTGSTPGGPTRTGPGSTDTATFNGATPFDINITGVDNRYIGGWTFNAGDYEFTTALALITFQGAGITVNGGSVKLINAGVEVEFENSAQAGTAEIENAWNLNFHDDSSADNASITNNFYLSFQDNSTAGSATITSNDDLRFNDQSTAGDATITNNHFTTFYNQSTAGDATITNNTGGFLRFFGDSSAENASISNDAGGTLVFGSNDSIFAGLVGPATAGNAEITNNGLLLFRGLATGGQAQITNDATGLTDTDVIVDFSGSTGPNGGNELTVGSLAGDGVFYLGANKLRVGGNNLDREVSGDISDCGANGTECYAPGATGGSLIKEGTGRMTLSGNNTYTGGTTINEGTVVLGSNTAVGTGAISMLGGGNGLFGWRDHGQ